MFESWQSEVLVLFDLIRLFKEKPWNLEVAGALKRLIIEFRTRGYVDFEASGVALLSSAIIYRRKSEAILKLEEPPSVVTEKGEAELEELDSLLQSLKKLNIQMPFRSEHPVLEPSRVLQELLAILSRLGIELQETAEPIPPLVTPPPDEFMNTLSARIGEMDHLLMDMIEKAGKVRVRDVVMRDSQLETIRAFLVLLFILTLRDYDLVEQGGDIWVMLTGR